MKNRDLRYGGTTADTKELNAIVSSVRNSIATGNWQAGEETKKFEKEAAKFLGVTHGILTTSGSCAGLLALAALELPKGSEVIIPAVTFPTIFNIILQCGLVPVVVDVDEHYVLNTDVLEQSISPKTKAIIAVHALGYPCDMPVIMEVAAKYDLRVIEDNCDGWGSAIGKKKLGSWGDISITSFHGAHIVSTAGVGGGVFTNDSELAKNVRVYKDWGRQADTNKPNEYSSLPPDYNPRFIYEKIGYNFQALELQAAMGRIQLKRSNEIKRLRKKNAGYLIKKLSVIPYLRLPLPPENYDICWFSLPITTVGERGPLVKWLEDHGIETRSMFSGNVTRHPAYANIKYRVGAGGLAYSDYVMSQSFWITVHPRLTRSDKDYIVKVFYDYFEENDRGAEAHGVPSTQGLGFKEPGKKKGLHEGLLCRPGKQGKEKRKLQKKD